MKSIIYQNRALYCENVRVTEIVEKFGTPIYIYSKAALTTNYFRFQKPLSALNHLVCFSVKSNSNLSILSLLNNLGAGFDVVSGGELYRLSKIGADTSKIVFSGVGKTEEELEYAIKNNILMINAESEQEITLINNISKRLKRRTRIAIRINPNVNPKTHPFITTGNKINKFGISVNEAFKLFIKSQKLKNIELWGIDCHIGSQLTDLLPLANSLKITKEVIIKLKNEGINLKAVDIGGGLGISYKDEDVPHPKDYAKLVNEILGDLNITIIFEPGRVISATTGILCTTVLYTKKSGSKNFVIIDAGMNDFVRPSLYSAYQKIIPLSTDESRVKIKVDIVGPICESTDFMAKDRTIQSVRSGEYLAIMDTGAYGFVMSSNYNSRCKIPEVLVDNDKFKLIRKRETYDDLIKLDII